MIIIVFISGCNTQYYVCTDKLADDICKEKGYATGYATGVQENIFCFKDERSYTYTKYKFLEGELDKCILK